MSNDTSKSILNSNGRFPGHKLSLKEKSKNYIITPHLKHL